MDIYRNELSHIAKTTLKAQKVKHSHFKVWEYLSTLLDRVKEMSDSKLNEFTLPSKQGVSYVYTLGEGAYFYDEYEKAEKHRQDGVVIKAKLKRGTPMFHIQQNIDYLIEFLSGDFDQFIKEKFRNEPDYFKAYMHIKQLIEIEAFDEFDTSPHAAGITIDLMRHFKKFEGTDVYISQIPKYYEVGKLENITELVVKKDNVYCENSFECV